MAPLSKKSSILIVGAGTWGLSTALHLARRGYGDVRILDQHPVPSPTAAGNDINKILNLFSSAPRGSAHRIVSDKLAEDAVRGWKEDLVFQGLFHETGAVRAASSDQGKKALEDGDRYSAENGWTLLETKEQFQQTMPDGVLTGEFPNWRGWWRADGCGWVEARNALIRTADEAKNLGVRFITGESGRVLGLIYERNDIAGVVVASGPPVRADRIIVCAGANAASLLDVKDQLRPTAWTLSHIKMTAEEVKLFKNLPVLLNIERGFFMEPDDVNHELKICDEHPGYCNWETSSDGSRRTSTPFAHHQIPKEAEARVRRLLNETMPHLAERPLSFARICWCADTPDRSFLISQHPDYASLVLGIGGSGHGFSYMPAIGGVIVDCLEGQMHPQMKDLFKWRPESAIGRDWTAVQGRFGPPGSNHVMDLQQVTEWTSIAN